MSTISLINPAMDRENPIALGRQGETGVKLVNFLLADLIEIYGEGVPVVLYLRPDDTVPYEPDLTITDTCASWTVTSTDTASAGTGTVEFEWITTDGDVLKSETWKAVVLKSLACTCDEPEAADIWLDRLAALKLAAEEAAESAATSADSAEESADSAEASASAAETAQAAAEASAEAAAACAAEAAAEVISILESESGFTLTVDDDGKYHLVLYSDDE